MMIADHRKRVTRDEVWSVTDYETVRDEFRRKVLALKKDRRVHLGDYFTFLFENHDTVLYQIQEMIRAERLESEDEIQHEIDTYNELVGDPGELGATLLIEIDDPEKRDELLTRWGGLPESFYIGTADGARISPEVDGRQVGERRISAVHYLKFRLGDRIPRTLGSTHPDVDAEVELEPPQVRALTTDLIGAHLG